jgi:hypothetical protein
MKDYGEIPGGKNELRPLLYPFIDPIPSNFFQDSDGSEILAFNLFCRYSTKRENGLL